MRKIARAAFAVELPSQRLLDYCAYAKPKVIDIEP